MKTQTKLLFLDLNVLSYLGQANAGCDPKVLPPYVSPDRLREVYERLRKGVRERVLRLQVSQGLLQEMSGIYASGRRNLFKEILSLSCELSCGHVLKDAQTRVPLEIRRGARLSTARALLPKPEVTALWHQLRDDRGLRKLAAETREKKQQYEQAEREKRDRIRQRLLHDCGSERAVQARVDEWFADRDARIEEWVRDALEGEAGDWGLSHDKNLWPDTHKLPTLWNLWSLRLADIYFLAKGGSLKSRASFQFDLLHFADASYANEFVTTDEALLRRLHLVDRGQPKCLGLQEFVEATLDA